MASRRLSAKFWQMAAARSALVDRTVQTLSKARLFTAAAQHIAAALLAADITLTADLMARRMAGLGVHITLMSQVTKRANQN